MKPAALAVVAGLRAGVSPSVLQFAALLRENGDTPAEARPKVASYAEATAGESSAEAQAIALLRSFSLRPD
jgi:hypothetical protein